MVYYTEHYYNNGMTSLLKHAPEACDKYYRVPNDTWYCSRKTAFFLVDGLHDAIYSVPYGADTWQGKLLANVRSDAWRTKQMKRSLLAGSVLSAGALAVLTLGPGSATAWWAALPFACAVLVLLPLIGGSKDLLAEAVKRKSGPIPFEGPRALEAQWALADKTMPAYLKATLPQGKATRRQEEVVAAVIEADEWATKAKAPAALAAVEALAEAAVVPANEQMALERLTALTKQCQEAVRAQRAQAAAVEAPLLELRAAEAKTEGRLKLDTAERLSAEAEADLQREVEALAAVSKEIDAKTVELRALLPK